MAQTFTSIQPRAGGFLVSRANGTRSVDNIVLVSGQVLPCGSVLGKITASGKFTQYNPANADGSQTAAGILWDATDASAGDAKCAAVTREAEVNTGELVWFAGATGAQITAGIANLATAQIIARSAL